jgi:hypothetical protein
MRFHAEPCGADRYGIYLASGELIAYHWDFTLALALVARLNSKG